MLPKISRSVSSVCFGATAPALVKGREDGEPPTTRNALSTVGMGGDTKIKAHSSDHFVVTAQSLSVGSAEGPLDMAAKNAIRAANRKLLHPL